MTVKTTLPTLVSFSASRPWESLKMKWPFDLELATTTTACIKAFQRVFVHPRAKVRNQRAPALGGSQNAAGLTQPRTGTRSTPLFGLGCSQIPLILSRCFPLRWWAPEPVPDLGRHWFHVIGDWIEHLWFNRNKKLPVPKGQSHQAGGPSLTYGMVFVLC